MLLKAQYALSVFNAYKAPSLGGSPGRRWRGACANATGSVRPRHRRVVVLPPITVTSSRALESEPTDAASEQRVSGETLNTRPIERPGEVLEAVPGLIVTQHSGEGKANQYFLRGFNLDHGTDLAIWLDGMPINMRTHGHGQGYADINFLIPELRRAACSSARAPTGPRRATSPRPASLHIDLRQPAGTQLRAG